MQRFFATRFTYSIQRVISGVFFCSSEAWLTYPSATSRKSLPHREADVLCQSLRPPTVCVGHRSQICHAELTVVDPRERRLRFHDIEDLIRNSTLHYLAGSGVWCSLSSIQGVRICVRWPSPEAKAKDDCPVDISATLSTF